MYNFDGFGHTAFASATVGIAAAPVTIPQPSSIGTLGPSIDPVNDLIADELVLDAPAANTNNIFVDLEATAVLNADIILRPGDSKRISGASKTTLSAIAGAAGQVLEIAALYR